MSINDTRGGGSSGIQFRLLWAELNEWRTHFTWFNALNAFIFGLVPSIWDVVSDYMYAETWGDETYFFNLKALNYFFICLPVLMLVLPIIQQLLKSLAASVCRERCLASRWSSLLGNSFIFILLTGVAIGVIYTLLVQPIVSFYASIPSAIIILLIKVLAIFVNGPEMMKTSIQITALEGQFEATFQLLVIATGLLVFNKPLDAATISCICSTYLMIGKAGVENLLMMGEENIKVVSVKISF